MTEIEAQDLKRMVDYQSGSIVSRTLLEKETGTLTLFAFSAGQGLSEHTAPFDATVLILEGEAVITIDGEEYVLEAGRLIIMPAGRPHAVKAVQQFKMLLIMIRS